MSADPSRFWTAQLLTETVGRFAPPHFAGFIEAALNAQAAVTALDERLADPTLLNRSDLLAARAMHRASLLRYLDLLSVEEVPPVRFQSTGQAYEERLLRHRPSLGGEVEHAVPGRAAPAYVTAPGQTLPPLPSMGRPSMGNG